MNILLKFHKILIKYIVAIKIFYYYYFVTVTIIIIIITEELKT